MQTVKYEKRFPRSVYRTVLPSGTEVWTMPKKGSRMVTLRVTFPFGALHDGENKGIGHFLEHVVMGGARPDGFHPALQELEKRGCTFGASTGWRHMEFSMSGLTEDAVSICEAWSDILQRPQFTADTVDAERRVILAEIAEREPAEAWVAWLLPRAFPDLFSPFMPMGGTRDLVENMTVEEIMAHMQRMLRLDTAQFTAVGGMTHDQHLEQILRLYPQLEQPKEHVSPKSVSSFTPPQGVYVTHSAGQKTAQDFSFHGSADERESVHLGIAIQALGATPYGMLFEHLRTKLRCIYSLSHRIDDWPGPHAVFNIPSIPTIFDEVQAEFLKVIERVREKHVPQEIFERVMADRRVFFATRAESFGGSKAAQAMRDMWFAGEVEDTDYEHLVMSTTPDQVRDAARRYLDPATMGVVRIVRP